MADPGLVAGELRALVGALAGAAASAGFPLTSVRLQHHTGVANAAPFDAPVFEVRSYECRSYVRRTTKPGMAVRRVVAARRVEVGWQRLSLFHDSC